MGNADRVLSFREQVEGACFAVTNRHSGFSSSPYDGLNLATHVGDDLATVADNRRALSAEIGVPAIAWMDQVHGADVAFVDAPGSLPVADALVTRTRGLALAVLVADCTPVLVADPGAGVIGVAHAGRKGLALGVVPALIAAMRSSGARTLVARVGPSICGRCYEVPLSLREEVAAGVPEARSVTRFGAPSLSIAAGVVAQLVAGGADVNWLPGCSAESAGLYSYRRDGGRTGRYAGLVWLA